MKRKKKPKAIYKCMKCKHRYKGEPGPTHCPKCGHIYIEWINYKLWT